MATKKGKLIDLFKTPNKITKTQYSSIDNSLKAKNKIDNETTDMMIVLYCFIFLFALVFVMTIIYTDDASKYGYKGTSEKYSLWESIKMKLFGVPKHQLPRNCYIVPSQNNTKCNNNNNNNNKNDNNNSSTSSCINNEGKTCQQVNEEWNKGMLADNENTENTTDNTTNNTNDNNEKCKTVSYPHNIEMDAVNQCLKQ